MYVVQLRNGETYYGSKLTGMGKGGGLEGRC